MGNQWNSSFVIFSHEVNHRDMVHFCANSRGHWILRTRLAAIRDVSPQKDLQKTNMPKVYNQIMVWSISGSILLLFFLTYPLVMTNIAVVSITILNGKIHYVYGSFSSSLC